MIIVIILCLECLLHCCCRRQHIAPSKYSISLVRAAVELSSVLILVLVGMKMKFKRSHEYFLCEQPTADKRNFIRCAGNFSLCARDFINKQVEKFL